MPKSASTSVLDLIEKIAKETNRFNLVHLTSGTRPQEERNIRNFTKIQKNTLQFHELEFLWKNIPSRRPRFIEKHFFYKNPQNANVFYRGDKLKSTPGPNYELKIDKNF